MKDDFFSDAPFMRQCLDAMPSMVLVTDADARILFRNQAAAALTGGGKVYSTRAGEALHCLHARDVAAGCGRGPACSECIVRKGVNAAFSGQETKRARTEIAVELHGKRVPVQALVSSAPLLYGDNIFALVVVEDVSELAELRTLLPICSSCKKIRAEDGNWEQVEAYIKAHVPEASLSHGLCPACARKLYPGHSD